MRRLLLLWPIAVLAIGLGCVYFPISQPTRKSGPSLRALAQGIAAPQGYAASKAPALFKHDNLYEAIDGMDGEYMSYGCVALVLLEWAKPADALEKIQAEISDMGSPLGAFGIYSRAHTGQGDFADVGEEAAVAEDAVEFARGRFYVRLMGPPDARRTLENMARAIVARIPPGPKPEQFIASLPSEGRIPRSERWIPSAAFGMDFMRNVVAARYAIGDKTVELSLASFANPATAQDALTRFRENVKTRSPQTAEGNSPGFVYADEYLGRVGVFQVARQLAVIVGYDKGAAVEALLARVAASQSHSIGGTGQRP